MSDQVQAVVSAVVIAIVALVGVAIAGPIAGLADEATPSSNNVIEPAPGAYTYVTDSSSTDNVRVAPGTGTAVRFSSSGYFDLSAPDPATRADGWALAVTVEPQTIDRNNTYAVYAEANATILVTYEAGNYSARYETPSGNTSYVTAPASGGQQSLGVEYANAPDELRLYVDGSLVDTDTPDATIDPRSPAYEWDGTIDEFRRWNTTVGAATHSAYAADPVQVLNTSTATHRAMFNDNDPSTVYYANGSASLVGGTEVVDGVQPPDLERGVDYELRTGPIEIRSVDGGYLDGAPAVFVSSAGPLAGAVASVTGGIGSAFSLIPLVLLALLSTVVIAAIMRLQP